MATNAKAWDRARVCGAICPRIFHRSGPRRQLVHLEERVAQQQAHAASSANANLEWNLLGESLNLPAEIKEPAEPKGERWEEGSDFCR